MDAAAPDHDDAVLIAHYRRALEEAADHIAGLERSLAMRLGRCVIRASNKPQSLVLLPFHLIREHRQWRREKEAREPKR